MSPPSSPCHRPPRESDQGIPTDPWVPRLGARSSRSRGERTRVHPVRHSRYWPVPTTQGTDRRARALNRRRPRSSTPVVPFSTRNARRGVWPRWDRRQRPRRPPGFFWLLNRAAHVCCSNVVIDPLAVRGDRWFRSRLLLSREGDYFGVPLVNSPAGRWWAGSSPGASPAVPSPGAGSPRGGVGLYYGVLAFGVGMTIWIGEFALAERESCSTRCPFWYSGPGWRVSGPAPSRPPLLTRGYRSR
jgi:hypothetical protein